MSQDRQITYVFDLDDPFDAKILNVLKPVFEHRLRLKAVQAGLRSRPRHVSPFSFESSANALFAASGQELEDAANALESQVR